MSSKYHVINPYQAEMDCLGSEMGQYSLLQKRPNVHSKSTSMKKTRYFWVGWKPIQSLKYRLVTPTGA